MARLECNLREVTAEGYPPTTLIELIGSVDPDTLEIFEGAMDEVADSGKPHVIFDMHRLKYINSTGMGMLVQFVDSLREEGGGLVLMRMQPKVLLVVEMLGLQELFQIVSTEEEALVALAGGEVGPQSIEVKLEEPEGKADKVPEPVPVIEIDEPEEEKGVPIAGSLTCPACQAVLVAPTSGNYRCPRCSSALMVNEEGMIEAYPEAADQIVEMTIPADDGYLDGAFRMISLAGEQAGLTNEDAEAVADSTRNCLQLLGKHAVNGNSSDRRLHLFVRPDLKHLTVRIYCSGSALSSKNVFDPFRERVDRLEYMASPQGNLVTLEKRA